jgi:hypothetical protein
MHDSDQMTDSPELRELRDSLSNVAMPGPPRLEAITGRARARRRQQLTRVTRVSAAGVVAVSVVAVGVSGGFSPAQKLGTIRTAAYTLRHNQNGTDTLTLNPVELLNPSQLQSDLAQYGIPAKVTSGSYCTTTPEPAGFSQVVTGPGPGTAQGGSADQPTITIDPSQMPSGTELSVGDFQISSDSPPQLQADMDLIDSNSYTCSSTPPTLGPDTPGMGILYGGSSDGGHYAKLSGSH